MICRGRFTDGHVGRASPRFVKKVWADVFYPQASLNPEHIPFDSGYFPADRGEFD